jgi:hypothetical protein
MPQSQQQQPTQQTNQQQRGSRRSRSAAASGSGGGADGSEGEGEGDEGDDPDFDLPRKRTRTAAPISRLVDVCADRAARWGPPMAALLRQHGATALHGAVEGSMSAAAAAAAGGGGCCYATLLLRGIAARLPAQLAAAGRERGAGAAAGAAGPGSGSNGPQAAAGFRAAKQWDELLWLLRVSRELALVWPAQLHPAAAAAASQQPGIGGAQQQLRQEQLEQAEEAGVLWQRIWAAVVAFTAECGAGAAAGQAPQSRTAGFGYAPAIREAAVWLLQTQLASRLRAASGGGLNRPALAAQLRGLWAPPFADAEGALLAALANGEQLAGARQSDGNLHSSLVAACIQTIVAGGPGGGSALALAQPPSLAPRPPVLAAFHALLSAPPALAGPALAEMRCESAAAADADAAGDDAAVAAMSVDCSMLAARLLAQQDAWESGLAPPSLLQSPRLAAEAAGAFAGGSAVAAALATAGGGSFGNGGAAGAGLCSGGTGAAAAGEGAYCDWWAPDAEAAVGERLMAALEPADERLARRLEGARALNLVRQIGEAEARSSGGEPGLGVAAGDGGRHAEAWWVVAAAAARQLESSLQEIAERSQPTAIQPLPLGSSDGGLAMAAATLATAAGDAARQNVLPLLQAATAAVALCSAAAVRLPAPAAAMDVDGDQPAGSQPSEEDLSYLLGRRLARAAAVALLHAGRAMQLLLSDAAAFYPGSPLLRQLDLLAAEIARLARLRREVVADLAAALAEVFGLLERAATGAAVAAAQAAEAAAARYMQRMGGSEVGFSVI